MRQKRIVAVNNGRARSGNKYRRTCSERKQHSTVQSKRNDVHCQMPRNDTGTRLNGDCKWLLPFFARWRHRMSLLPHKEVGTSSQRRNLIEKGEVQDTWMYLVDVQAKPQFQDAMG